jgi:hypothetical protein
MKKLSILFASLLLAVNVQAEGLDASKIFLGGGISLNDVDGSNDDATGFQIFAGMPIPASLGKARLSGEVGYMDSGNFDHGGSAEGIWANAVIEVPVGNTVELVGRAGFDFGDDDGLMIGGGVDFPMASKVDLRFEYVIRDHIDSLQANVVFQL